MKPTWTKFTTQYPDYIRYPSSPEVKRHIGGNADAGYITNICAVRMSRGLNFSGLPLIKDEFPGVTVSGRDGMRYALRVADMRRWFSTSLGSAAFDTVKPAGEVFEKSSLAALKGIIAFDIRFSDGATGHLDRWDGRAFSNEANTEDYWTRATRISVWALD